MGKRASSSCLTPNSPQKNRSCRQLREQFGTRTRTSTRHPGSLWSHPTPMPARALPALAEPGASFSRALLSKHYLCTGKTSGQPLPCTRPCLAPYGTAQSQSWERCESNSSLQMKPSPVCWGGSRHGRAQLVQRKSHVLHRDASILNLADLCPRQAALGFCARDFAKQPQLAQECCLGSAERGIYPSTGCFAEAGGAAAAPAVLHPTQPGSWELRERDIPHRGTAKSLPGTRSLPPDTQTGSQVHRYPDGH